MLTLIQAQQDSKTSVSTRLVNSKDRPDETESQLTDDCLIAVKTNLKIETDLFASKLKLKMTNKTATIIGFWRGCSLS